MIVLSIYKTQNVAFYKTQNVAYVVTSSKLPMNWIIFEDVMTKLFTKNCFGVHRQTDRQKNQKMFLFLFWLYIDRVFMTPSPTSRSPLLVRRYIISRNIYLTRNLIARIYIIWVTKQPTCFVFSLFTIKHNLFQMRLSRSN